MKFFGDITLKTVVRITSVSALAAVIALGVGLSPASAQSARKYRDVNPYGNGRGVNTNRNDIQRLAISRGYGEGFEEGTRARRDRRNSDFRRTSPYRNGKSGYNRSWNSERDYQNWYRQGFEKGFNDAFYGRARNRGYDRNNGGYNGGNGGYYGNNGSYNGGNGGYYGNNGGYNGNNGGYYGNNGGYNGYSNDRGDLSPQEVAQRAGQTGYYAGYQRGQYDAQQRNQSNPQGHGAFQFGYDGYDREWGSAQTYQQSYRSAFVRGYQDGYARRGNGYDAYRRRP
jgi:hypothetical protein